MLLNISNTDPKSPHFNKVKSDIFKALGVEKEWDKIKWPLPNLKEVDEKAFWSHATTWQFAADMHADQQKIDGDWHSMRLFWVNHSRLIDGGFAVAYRYEWRKEKVRYFTWQVCDHDFKSRTVGNCLTRYTCEKCGKAYEVDSSG